MVASGRVRDPALQMMMDADRGTMAGGRMMDGTGTNRSRKGIEWMRRAGRNAGQDEGVVQLMMNSIREEE